MEPVSEAPSIDAAAEPVDTTIDPAVAPDPGSVDRSSIAPVEEALDPRVVWYWRVSALPRLLLMLLPVAIIALTAFGQEKTVGLVMVGVAAAAFGSAALWTIVSAGLRFRRFRFRLHQGVLEVRRGVIIHREKRIPVDRMQHLDVDRGPVERVFGLARLVVFTAGGRTATFQLPGLSVERATALREQILAAR